MEENNGREIDVIISDNQTAVDDTKCVLLEFEDETVAVGYFNWLTSHNNENNIRDVIEKRQDVVTRWPNCAIGPACKMRRALQKCNEWSRHVVKIVAYGGICTILFFIDIINLFIFCIRTYHWGPAKFIQFSSHNFLEKLPYLKIFFSLIENFLRITIVILEFIKDFKIEQKIGIKKKNIEYWGVRDPGISYTQARVNYYIFFKLNS